MNLGETIRSIRKKKGLTQIELSKACGLSQTYLSRIENSKSNPSLKTIEAIGKTLDMPHQILMFLSLDSESVHPDKREIFIKLYPSVCAMITEYFTG